MRKIGLFLVVFLSVLCGVVASGLAYNYLKERADAEAPELTPVVVATHDMPFATVLGNDDMRVVMFPTSSIPDGAYESVDSLLNQSTKVFLKRNEPIMESKLSTVGGGLSLRIDPSMRAASIQVDKVSGVSGFIQPGDRVDVIATLKQNNEPVSKTILQNVLVLAAGETTENKSDKVMQVQSVTLLVSPEGSQALALAMREGKVDLALRNPADTLLVTADPLSRKTMLQGEKKPAPTVVYRDRPVEKKEEPKEPPKPPVTVFKGPQADTVRPAIQPNGTTATKP